MTLRDPQLGTYYGQFGPYISDGFTAGGKVVVTINATDAGGLAAKPLTITLTMLDCIIRIG
jgi:hypothetical protein